MDRRELLHAAGAAACVAVVPITFTESVHALGRIAWPETTVTRTNLGVMTPLLNKYKADPKVPALASPEWDSMALNHQSYFNIHAQQANLHALDLQIAANAAYLKAKYGTTYIEHAQSLGSYALFSQASGLMHEIATLVSHGPRVHPPSGGSCSGQANIFYGSVSALYIILPIVVAIPELILLFGVMGLLWEGMREYMCD